MHFVLILKLQIPVILVGNKIDLRGGEVTNEALEDEIVPIMNEFKVRAILPTLNVTLSHDGSGGRDLCGVFS